MKQAKLPVFAPPPVHRCRVCGRRITDAESVFAGIGPKCKAADDLAELHFLARMDQWNSHGDDDSYPCVKMGDINRLLGIIRRLKNNGEI